MMSDGKSDNKHKSLHQLARQVREFNQSPLYQYRLENDYRSVFGEGNPDADVMFIGEAPGKKEAETGRPFVGAAGRILDELLESIELDRENVYITNVVKDRPPENRDPTLEEIQLYTPFLSRQIQIIRPKVISTLGRFAMGFIFDYFDMDEQKGNKISKVHGKIFLTQSDYGKITIIPLFHPAVALYNNSQKDTLRNDFRKLAQQI